MLQNACLWIVFNDWATVMCHMAMQDSDLGCCPRDIGPQMEMLPCEQPLAEMATYLVGIEDQNVCNNVGALPLFQQQ